MPSVATFLFFKPFGVVCQFTPEGDHQTLADFGPFPHDVYPAGRLDTDSEGLLLLTSDANFLHRLTEPKFGHERTYAVQVERIPSLESIEQLKAGIMISGYRTKAAKVRILESEPDLPERPIPIRYRANVPTCWLEITLTEGKNRQVRRMTAAVGHPTLRLVRTGIAFLTLEGLAPGGSRQLTADELTRLTAIVGTPSPRSQSPHSGGHSIKNPDAPTRRRG